MDENHVVPRSKRRPAYIWLRKWGNSSAPRGVAFDVAVTSVTRGPPSCSDPGADAVTSQLKKYVDFKRAYLGTREACWQQGVAFNPLIVEAHGGGWDDSVDDMLRQSAQRIQAGSWRLPELPGVPIHAYLAQRLSFAVQASTARATIRRMAGGLDTFQ